MNEPIGFNTVESENLIVSMIMSDGSAVEMLHDELSPKHFVDNKAKQVYGTALELYENRIPIDVISLYDRIKFKDKTITQLDLFTYAENITSTANIDYHIKKIREQYKLRKIAGVLDANYSKALGDISSDELLTQTSNDLAELAKSDNIVVKTTLPPFSNAGKAKKPPKEELITGVLRQSHKMLISGASKMGKSFLLINLAVALVEGIKWIDRFQCAKGKVVYINMEIDNVSFDNRIHDVYEQKGIQKKNINDILIWNLRGQKVTMDSIVDSLNERLPSMHNVKAIILDPLYKILEGDENDAEAMTKFGNKIDEIANKNNISVVYCHHHTKGDNFSKKAQDRFSGSGVLARDPDAILDLIELETPKVDFNDISLDAFKPFIFSLDSSINPNEFFNNDMLESFVKVVGYIDRYCEDSKLAIYTLRTLISQEAKRLNKRRAFQLESSLREFEGFDDVNIWYDYPLHKFDNVGVLREYYPIGDPRNKKNSKVTIREPKSKSFKEFKQTMKALFEMHNGDIEKLIEAHYGEYNEDNKHKFLGHIEKSLDYTIDGSGKVISTAVSFN